MKASDVYGWLLVLALLIATVLLFTAVPDQGLFVRGGL